MPHVIFAALAPIFFVMALGYVAGRMRTIDNHHVGEINALVMDFALPASLFASTGSAPRGEMMAQGPLFAILGAVMLIIYLLWYLFERKALRRSRGEAALQALTVAVPNYAGIGLPIASTVLGPTATVSVAVALALGLAGAFGAGRLIQSFLLRTSVADPIVLGESVNTLTTYGYDPATGMQEPKATLCQIKAA